MNRWMASAAAALAWGLCSAIAAAEPAVGGENSTPPAASTSPATDAVDPAKLPEVKLDQAVMALLQRSARALESRTIEADEQPLFVELLVTADKLLEDKTLAPSERERWRAMIRVRLQQAAEVLKKQTTEQVGAARLGAPKSDAAPATVDLPQPAVLAQQLPFGQAGGGGLGGINPGGAAAPLNSAVQQSAQDLMDLITNTIKPESWQQNGGTGVIRYWALGHALVIRATSDVHDGVGDVVDQLRR